MACQPNNSKLTIELLQDLQQYSDYGLTNPHNSKLTIELLQVLQTIVIKVSQIHTTASS